MLYEKTTYEVFNVNDTFRINGIKIRDFSVEKIYRELIYNHQCSAIIRYNIYRGSNLNFPPRISRIWRFSRPYLLPDPGRCSLKNVKKMEVQSLKNLLMFLLWCCIRNRSRKTLFLFCESHLLSPSHLVSPKLPILCVCCVT